MIKSNLVYDKIFHLAYLGILLRIEIVHIYINFCLSNDYNRGPLTNLLLYIRNWADTVGTNMYIMMG